MRDSDAALIITDGGGMSVSIGTGRAHQWARQHGKPELVVDATDPKAAAHAVAWLAAQRKRFGADLTLSIGGPRESEAPGIYTLAKALIASILDRAP